MLKTKDSFQEKSEDIIFQLPKETKKFYSVFLKDASIELEINPVKISDEVWNCTTEEVCNFYSVIQDKNLFAHFKNLLKHTNITAEVVDSAVNYNKLPLNNLLHSPYRAFCYFVCNQSLKSNEAGFMKWAKINVDSYLPKLERLHRRLNRVTLKTMFFKEFINQYDSKDAVFYCEPKNWCVDKGSWLDEHGHSKTGMTPEGLSSFVTSLSAFKGKFLIACKSQLTVVTALKNSEFDVRLLIDPDEKFKSNDLMCLISNYVLKD